MTKILFMRFGLLSKIRPILFSAVVGVFYCSCQKDFVPKVRAEVLSADAEYTISNLTPILGRTTVFQDAFYNAESTLPLTFKIMTIRNAATGDSATELTTKVNVKVWNSAYTGNETSVAEIEAKRAIEYHSVFEVREHSGDFIMWACPQLNNTIATSPSPGYVFDVEVSNQGGRRYFKNLKLAPQKPLPYEPSNLDPETGLSLKPYVDGASLYNVQGENYKDVGLQIFIHKVSPVSDKQSPTITFKFLDTLYNPIKLSRFALTDWDNLLHGFNKQFNSDSTSVQYQVAYPIPLVRIPTRYTTSDGNKTQVKFAYSRLGFGNQLMNSSITFPFAIYEEGNWEIIFWFKGANPKFDND